MKRFFVLLFVAALPALWAQTAPKTTTGAASSSSTKTSATTSSTAGVSTTPPWIKLPPGIPKVVHGPVKSIPFAVHYEDVKVGTGAEGESGKLWHVEYTGWRAADGVEFDSWDKHVRPVIKDGKPEMGPDGKPKMSEPEPASIPQGVGGVIPGFDYGLAGMRIGGRRRIFIPWQLAYGTRNIPDRPDHPGIPAKSDLIFDVTLVDVTDMPAPRAMMPPRPMPPHPNAANPPGAAPAAKPATPAQPAAGAPTQPTAQPATPAQPATAPQPSNPQPATPSPAPSTTPPTQPQSK
jgi:peptidylprolyl isomerase